MKTDFDRLKLVAESWKAEQILSWAFATYGEDVAIATGMGAEGMVLLDIASRINPDMKVFTGDTEFLFPETYDLIDRVEERYGIKIERILSQLSPEEQEREFGPRLWANNPDRCCELRKVAPLRRKLSTLDAWITAIRRGQTPERAGAKKIDWDPKFNLVKINPLADWTHQQVWSYIVKNDVPYNPLHDRSYPSIGCTNCTRAVRPGEDARAGRWAGFGKTECGLHTPATASANLVQLAAVGAED
ncbi:MAG TPA: phosphoadenylyl-sulfate reductase [Terriglobales bacterium]|nr:phosphoadenylyl-sulfate reductase [Terriglobales bacterium]